MILTVTIVLIIISLVAFIFYRNMRDDASSQNLGAFGMTKAQMERAKARAAQMKKDKAARDKAAREKAARDKAARDKAAREKAAREAAAKKAKDPCEWVKQLRKE